MMVSVSIVTYQQVGMIRQAVESALSQRTNFPFEVIVGDDASTDGTRDPLKRMAVSDARLKLLLAQKNPGDNGLTNVMSTIDAALGRYVAFLDGDDYWTDPGKLQKQVDFLEAHPDCDLCAHWVTHLDEAGNRTRSPRPPRPIGMHSVGDLLVTNFAPKCATVVRRSAIAALPDWYRTTDAASADWLFNVLVSRNGRIGFINEDMAVHRMHSANLTTLYGADRMLDDKLKMLAVLRSYITGMERDFRRAERLVRWKRRAIWISPRGFIGIKRLRSLIR